MKNLLNIKLKAGALQYTIFISVVIALLVFGFIGLTHVQQKLRLKNTVFKDVIYKNESAFRAFNDFSVLKDLDNIETTVSKKQWGLFDVVSIKSKKRKEEITKTALVGGSFKDKPALYLQDENQPLVVIGTTKIEGKTLLPEQGVKQGSITGHSYVNNQLIYGSIQNSKSQLPKSNSLERLKNFKDSIINQTSINSLEFKDKPIINSFDQPTLNLSVMYPIELRESQLAGNIVIQSTQKITIYKSSKLTDVILIAPKIEIKDNVEGNFQVFAEKELIVGKEVQLNYPSALILLEKRNAIRKETQSTTDVNQIMINNKSIIKGVVAFLSENKDGNYESQLVIEDNTEITGEVYCNKNLELKGTVKGSVYTRGFIANQFGSKYMNHLYNGQILNSELPKEYVGLSFENSKQKVAKWLYY